MNRALFIVGLLSLALLTGNGCLNQSDLPLNQGLIEPRVKGYLSAGIKLIEYSDFQCPACAAYYQLVKKIVEGFGHQIAFEYRHFPLKQHAHAELTARVAEAAGQQGKFWEMHDLLFEKQADWSDSDNVLTELEGYVVQLGLNLERFRQDLNSKSVKDKVKSDLKSGQSLAVNATPTFLLNGVKIKNPGTYEEWKTLIENAINQK